MDKSLQTMISNMPDKTGKSLEQWTTILKEKDYTKHSEGVNFLKKEHGVTHGFANTIVTLSKSQNDAPEDLVTNQYKGKELLFPMYEKLLATINTFGNDITITPKKSSVSVIRKRQFVLIKPATKTRIDLGLKLPEKSITVRLGSSGPFGTMCTHRVQITAINDIDEELIDWMKEAYDIAE